MRAFVLSLFTLAAMSIPLAKYRTRASVKDYFSEPKCPQATYAP